MADRIETYTMRTHAGEFTVTRNIETGEQTVEPVTAATDETGSEGSGFEGMKVVELKAYADEHGIDLGEATKKADIIAAITAAEGE